MQARTTEPAPSQSAPQVLTSLLALIVLLFGLSAALAEVARLYARPGETIVIKSSTKLLELQSASSDAVKLTVDAPAANQPKTSVITYTAPPDASAGSEVTVGYSEGGAPRSVLITVSAGPRTDAAAIATAGSILAAMLVVAIVLESAFAVVFNWRVFLEFFDGRGVRTLVMLVGALAVVLLFGLDFVGALFAVYVGGGSGEAASTWGGVALTALVLAGGSASVNSLLVALNLRENRKAEDFVEKPAPTKAWVAIKVDGRRDTETVEFFEAETPSPPADAMRLVGTLQTRRTWERLAKYFVRDKDRLPPSRGYEVDPSKQYTFVIRCSTGDGARYFDALGTPLVAELPAVDSTLLPPLMPKPRSFVFAPGAIVDFRVSVARDKDEPSKTTS